MKKGIRRALCVAVPVLGLIALWLLQALVTPKYANEENREGGLSADYYEWTGEGHDVLFLGDCEAYESYTPPTLFEKYGITSVIRGTPQQLVWHSYYLLRDTLRYETPKAVVLNVYALRYGEPQNEAYNRLVLDGMRWSPDKVAAVGASMTDEETFASYLFPLLRYHGRWGELTEDDVAYLWKHKTVSHNGYLMQTGVVPQESEKRDPFPLSDYTLPARSMEYLERIRALCVKKGIELILVKAPTNSADFYWFDEWEKQIRAYAENYGLSYYNFIPLAKEIGLDWSTDTYDGGIHLNVSGAEKLTDYIGKLLQLPKHGIPDRRDEADTAALWAEKIERYYAAKGGNGT